MTREIPIPPEPLTVEERALVEQLSDEDLERIDDALLQSAERRFLKVARVASTVMLSPEYRYRGLPDEFYRQRLCRLVDEGRLESQGNLDYMRFSEVRLPPNEGPARNRRERHRETGPGQTRRVDRATTVADAHQEAGRPVTSMGLLHSLATLALGPVLLVQSRAVRRRIPRLDEPPGSRQGETGRGPLLRLLLTGDSAAAGVGASHQDEALLGRVVSGLAAKYRVQWTLQARSGATTANTLRRLQRLKQQDFDLVVTSLGLNDVTSGSSRSRWRRSQARLRTLLRERFGAGLIVVSGLPPVADFPALPQPLRWVLAHRARSFDQDLERAAQAEDGCTYVRLDLPGGAHLMAEDGFHPGPGIYAAWANRVAQAILQREEKSPRPLPLSGAGV